MFIDYVYLFFYIQLDIKRSL